MAMVNMMLRTKRQKPVPSVMNKTPHIGIELEFDSLHRAPIQWYAERLLKAGMHHCAQIETMPDMLELHLLTTEGLYYHEIGILLDIIKEGHGFIDERSELHIHVDCRHRNRMDVYNTLVEYQDMMFCVADKKQIRNPFCIPNRKGQPPYSMNAIHPSNKHETIEVRLFEATLDVDKLAFFINTVVGIVNFNVALEETSVDYKGK